MPTRVTHGGLGMKHLLLFPLLILLLSSGLVSTSGSISASHSASLTATIPPRDLIPLTNHATSAANNSTVTLPCWAVNATICVAINASQSAADNVVPQSPPSTGANYHDYPKSGDNIFFDIYSKYNLIKAWGGTGSTNEFNSTNAYLYLSVTDVQWNGVHWFCTCDGTVWHADAGDPWAPSTQVNATKTIQEMVYPHTPGGDTLASSCLDETSWYNCTITTKYIYTLEIQGTATAIGGGTSSNFRPGSFVQWNVTSVHYSSTTGRPAYNSTSNNFGLFNFYIKGAWYWSPTPGSGCSYAGNTQLPCYPNTPNSPTNPNCPLNQTGNYTATAFACNLNLNINPTGQPTVGTSIVINLSINGSWQMYSGAKIQSATLYATAYNSTGGFWMNWESGFTTGRTGWPATNATVTLPGAFFPAVNYTLEWYIVAYDQGSDSIQSENYTEVVSPFGLFTQGTNFSFNLNLTTSPAIIGNETSKGTLSNDTVPVVAIGQSVNVTISSVSPLVAIGGANLYWQVCYPEDNQCPTGGYSMNHTTLTTYYKVLPSLAPGASMTFLVKAWDRGADVLQSHSYQYDVPAITSPPAGEGIFYVDVYDNASGHQVTGANVSIVGDGGTVQIKTVTFSGLAYPNDSGNNTPKPLPDNTTYAITVQWDGFNVSGTLAGTDSLKVFIFLTHTMNVTKRLAAGPNYYVLEKGNVILFSLNVPPPPPTFSRAVPSNGLYIEAIIGMAVATAVIFPIYFIWKEIRRHAEEEEKRVTL